MTVFEATLKRRSVRKFKTQPIPEEVITKMLESARFAPSWANTQCFRFILLKEDTSKNRILEAFSPRNPAYSSILAAPLVVVAFAEKKKSGFYKGEAVTNKGDYWYMFDTALALQNMVLTAWEEGVGSVYLGLFDAEKVRVSLNIPDNFEVVAIVPFGYPDEEPKCPPRKEIREIVYYESYTDSKDL
ncbi:MAG: nitroreductase family protein [Proteobacteria bacterium]|nr:nitroreductase family protein [Pseudomonadota bacterium]